jgi:hypothetical protein
MKPRTKNILRIFLASLAVFVVAVLAGLVPLHIGVFSPALAERVRDATGLELELGGPVVVPVSGWVDPRGAGALGFYGEAGVPGAQA